MTQYTLSRAKTFLANSKSASIVAVQESQEKTCTEIKQRRIWLACVAVFFVSFLLLLLGMDRNCTLYDEGIVLVAAMKVGAGLVPYRDFYANYGPAEFYILAWLFKLFGPSVFVERLFDLLVNAGIVTMCFALADLHCSRFIAILTSAVCWLWLFSFTLYGPPLMPALLLSLIGSGLLLTGYRWRFPAAGAITGLTALFRPDIGFGLLIVHLCFLALTERGFRILSASKYMLGTAVIFGPVALTYLTVAPARDFIFDLITYPSKYYAHARNLPFPGLHLRMLDSLGVYLPILVLGILVGIYFSSRNLSKFLLLFGLLILMMYCKGLVRVSTYHMFVAISLSLIVIAVLFDHLGEYNPRLRYPIMLAALLAAVTATRAAIPTVRGVPRRFHSSVTGELLAPSQTCDGPQRLRTGLCFLVDADHVRAIDFIDSHTTPNDELFIGLPHHDKIWENDILTYFATERMPATRWYHFDPDLQTTADIQREMIGDITSKSVRYILLDSEFDNHYEPNDSSRSSGVTLLDDFIRANYRETQQFGKLSVWQLRKSPA